MSHYSAYLLCEAGVNEELLLGALVDAGLSLDVVHQTLTALPFTHCQVVYQPRSLQGIRGGELRVVRNGGISALRTGGEVQTCVQKLTLPLTQRARVQQVMQLLLEAEAVVQGMPVEEVVIAQYDMECVLTAVVAIVAGIDILEIADLCTSPLPLTHTVLADEHGWQAIPSPVVVEIARRVQAPWRPTLIEGALVNEVGMALLAALARFETPPLTVLRTGYGIGNGQQFLRLWLGQRVGVSGTESADAETDWVTVIETHVDTITGELLGGLMERLFAAGALDVSYTPIQMKKDRPATLITVIARLEDGERLAMLLLRESSTLGVRLQQVQRLKAQRMQQRVTTPLGEMLVKVKRLGGKIVSVAPEYEECKRIAEAWHLPLAEVYEVARQAALTLIIRDKEKHVETD